MFHPLTFKTLTCPMNQKKADSCDNRNCPYFHSEDEKRIITQFAVLPIKTSVTDGTTEE